MDERRLRVSEVFHLLTGDEREARPGAARTGAPLVLLHRGDLDAIKRFQRFRAVLSLFVAFFMAMSAVTPLTFTCAPRRRGVLGDSLKKCQRVASPCVLALILGTSSQCEAVASMWG
jgi:hypothetical protein